MDEPVPFELESSWQKALRKELQKPYVAQLAAFLKKERNEKGAIFPPKGLEFSALKATPYEKVKVVIVGQDPYHGAGQAHGLSFSVPNGVTPPPSLKNIYKELVADVGFEPPTHGCLTSWAEQGVLLLNATLTVRQSDPMSHHGKGWELFTDAIIEKLCERKDPLVFVLWGRSAQRKCERVAALHVNPQHTILKAAHPSPLSAHSGFFGCKHFSKINEVLLLQKKTPIDWTL